QRNTTAAQQQTLIVRAQQRLEQEDIRAAIEEVTQLQARWQQVGIMLRPIDQKRWREFRAACDPIFARKQQQNAEFKEELGANLTAAEQLISRVRELSELSGQALLDSRKEVGEIQQSFAALGEIGRASCRERV